MQTDLFSSRHIGITDQELPQMLATIGVKSIEELIDQTIPTNIRLKKPLQLPAAMTEAEFLNHIRQIAAKNSVADNFIGLSSEIVCTKS